MTFSILCKCDLARYLSDLIFMLAGCFAYFYDSWFRKTRRRVRDGLKPTCFLEVNTTYTRSINYREWFPVWWLLLSNVFVYHPHLFKASRLLLEIKINRKKNSETPLLFLVIYTQNKIDGQLLSIISR